MTHPMTMEDNIASASYDDVIYALQFGDTPRFVRNYILGSHSASGSTERFEVWRAKCLLNRLLVLLEEDRSMK